jgi:hypothetical protein
MALSKKQQARYRAIVRTLSQLSSIGWSHATHPDYEPLEKELAQLANNLVEEKSNMKEYRVSLTASRPQLPELGEFTVTVDIKAPNPAAAERLGRAKVWSPGLALTGKAIVTEI